MKKNVGMIDRIIRVLLAVIIAALYFTQTISGTIAIILLAIAVIFFATASIGYCPIWHGLGIKTNKQTEKQ